MKTGRKILMIGGCVLLLLSIVACGFLCTDIRVRPEARKQYVMGPATVQNDDMNLLLQMLNNP